MTASLAHLESPFVTDTESEWDGPESDEEEPDIAVEFEEESSRSRYKRFLKHGIKRLVDGTGRGGTTFGAPTSTSRGKYPKGEWERELDVDFSSNFPDHIRYHMLVLKKGKGPPSRAIKRIVDNPHKWTMDCAYFVQVAHLYAKSRVNPRGFDRSVAGVPFALRYHHSTGVGRNFYFDRERRADPWDAWFRLPGSRRTTRNSINTARWTTAKIKAAMPIGSRLMWRNELIGLNESAWRNENAVKVGNDRYQAFPLGRGPLRERQIKLILARKGMNEFPRRHSAGLSVAEYARRHIFLSEAQRFYTP